MGLNITLVQNVHFKMYIKNVNAKLNPVPYYIRRGNNEIYDGNYTTVKTTMSIWKKHTTDHLIIHVLFLTMM